jgi:hypothetical protein
MSTGLHMTVLYGAGIDVCRSACFMFEARIFAPARQATSQFASCLSLLLNLLKPSGNFTYDQV